MFCPLAYQVQHTVCWVASFVSLNGLHDLVLHTEEGAKSAASVHPMFATELSKCQWVGYWKYGSVNKALGHEQSPNEFFNVRLL